MEENILNLNTIQDTAVNAESNTETDISTIFPKYTRRKDAKYSSNKEIEIQSIDGIYIKNFRSMKERTIELGRYITIITGKNGTMKSSLLGLIAHPFGPIDKSKDIFDDELKTDMKNVFKLSLDKDRDKYEYFILLTSKNNEKIIEPIRIFVSEKENRHRVVVSGHTAGDGNFNMKTNYINLKRLFPVVDTSIEEAGINLTPDDKRWIADSYQKVIQKTEYSDNSTFRDKNLKRTCAQKIVIMIIHQYHQERIILELYS